MRRLLPLGLAAVCLLAACDSSSQTTHPPTLYAGVTFEAQDLTVHRAVGYTTRPNPTGDQYTSEKTMDVERTQSTLTPKMDVYVPPNATEQARQPVLVFVHGGGFSRGSREGGPSNVEQYARAGYVAVALDYRLTADNDSSPERRLRAMYSATEDVQNAIRFLKVNARQYRIDTTRVAVIGASAGGFLSLMSGEDPDRSDLKSDHPGVSSRVQAVVSTGATLTANPGRPGSVTYESTDAPVLLFHAKETDGFTGATWGGNVVPMQQAVVAGGGICEIVPQPDRSHTIKIDFGTTYWDERGWPFVRKYLRLDALR